MRLRRIELEGFQSYREPETVDVTSLRLVAIIGPNRSGKSSLLDAFQWALYARSRGPVAADVISRGADRARVSIEFDLGDNTYRVSRTRTRKGRHEVLVAVSDPAENSGWRPLEEKNSMQADAFIVNLLGMDSTTARATWIIGQSDVGAFCEMTPAARRVALAAAFGLEGFTDLATCAEERRRSAETSLVKTTVALEGLTRHREMLNNDGPFPTLGDEQIEIEAKTAEARGDTIIAELAALTDPTLDARATETAETYAAFIRQHQNEVTRHTSTATTAQRNVTTARSALATARSDKSALDTAEFEVAALQKDVTSYTETVKQSEAAAQTAQTAWADARSAHTGLRAEQSSIKSRGEDIKEQSALLRTSAEKGEGQCFACSQPLTEAHARSMTNELQAVLLSLRQEYTAKESAAQEVSAAGERHRAAATQADTNTKQARAALERTSEAVTRAKAILGRGEAIHASLTAAQESVTAAEKDLVDVGDAPSIDTVREGVLLEAKDTAKAALDKATGSPETKTALQTEQAETRNKARSLWREQHRREQVATEVAALTPRIDQNATTLATHQKGFDSMTVLMEAFRPGGIPAMILAGIIAEVNEEANDFLGRLGNDGLGINVTSTRETQKGTMTEKVMVNAVTPEGEVDYSTLSGAEKFRVAFALRLGIARCIARRSGTPMETIILDEGWGALDEPTRTAVQEVLTRLAQDFSVFTISHVDGVKDTFDTVISVSKETGTSRTEVLDR